MKRMKSKEFYCTLTRNFIVHYYTLPEAMIAIRNCRDAAIFLFVLLSFSEVVSFVRYFSFSKITSLPQCSNRKIPSYMMSNNEGNILVAQVRQTVKPGSIVVIKYGGHAMENDELKKLFCQDVAELCRFGVIPVIVHGGGPQIAKMLKSLNVESSFVDGLRVTDEKTMEVAQMVLCGSINKDIARLLTSQPGVLGCVGLSGLDNNLITAVQKDPRLGLVGEPAAVNAEFLQQLLKLNIVPLIAPVGQDAGGSGSLNINADTAAGAVAEALKADYFLLLTDIAGVMDKEKNLLSTIRIDSSSVDALKADGTISGGMIPKMETAAKAVLGGVGKVSITDGRVKNCVLRALSGESFGTILSR